MASIDGKSCPPEHRPGSSHQSCISADAMCGHSQTEGGTMSVDQKADIKIAERRRPSRRQPAMGTVCKIAGESGKKQRVGLVWNLSTSGVSMLLPEPIDVGSTLTGELAAMDGRLLLPITKKVAHVRQLATGDYFIGGQFG